jgi:hypothetical protein
MKLETQLHATITDLLVVMGFIKFLARLVLDHLLPDPHPYSIWERNSEPQQLSMSINI